MISQSGREIRESEEELVATAQLAVSQCNWVVGECAARWTQKYAKGRTDSDFGVLVGLSGDQIYQRRRVFETFGDVKDDYAGLKWSHFYAALTWDDAPECLQWAEENESTVAEMKAWRRSMHGEEVPASSAADFVDFAGDPAICQVPSERTFVRDPDDAPFEGGERTSRGRGGAVYAEGPESVAGVARETDRRGVEYAPFRSDAGSPAPKEISEGKTATVERPRPNAEQVVQRMTSALERMARILSPAFRKEFTRLPKPIRERFLKAIDDVGDAAKALSGE